MDNEKLNKIMQVIKPSQATVLTGAPLTGKTSLAFNIAVQYGLYEGKIVAIFSIELYREACVQWILCMSSKVSIKTAYACDFSQEELRLMANSRDLLHKSSLFIYDSLDLTVQDIIQKCEEIKERFGRLDFVIVDYLQLLSPITGDKTCNERANKLNE